MVEKEENLQYLYGASNLAMTTLFVILRLSKDHAGLCDSVSNYPGDLYVIKFFKNVRCLESGVKFPRLKNTNKIQTKTALL